MRSAHTTSPRSQLVQQFIVLGAKGEFNTLPLVVCLYVHRCYSPHHHTHSQCKLLTTPPHMQPVQATHHTTTHTASASYSPHHHTCSQCKLCTHHTTTHAASASYSPHHHIHSQCKLRTHHTTTHAASASYSPHHHTHSQCKLLTTPPHTQPVQAMYSPHHHTCSQCKLLTTPHPPLYIHIPLCMYCMYIESHYAKPQL